MLDDFYDSWYYVFVIVLYFVVVGLLLSFIEKDYWKVTYSLKFLEFLVYLFIMGWTSGFFGFEAFPLTLSILFNVFICLLWLRFYNNIGMIVIVIVLIFILLSVIVSYSFS